MKDDTTIEVYGTGTKVPDSFWGQLIHPIGQLQRKRMRN